jgi:hypothetical protein
MTDHTPSSANQDLSVLLEHAPRATDLATRLVAAGPKAAHVSTSETHEIAEFVHAAIAALRGSVACSPAADEKFVALFPNDGLSSAQFHELWERAGKYLNPNNSARENLPRQVGKFAAFVAREARGDGMAPERIIQAIRVAGFRDHPTDITRKCVNAIVNEVTPLLKPKQYSALAHESTSRPHGAPDVSAHQYHILKTDPDQFQAVVSGVKTFEIRLNDRGYAVGDVLGLRETRHTGAEMRAGAPLEYTGHECQRLISHVLTGYGLADGWCCLSFELPNAVGASAPEAVKRAENIQVLISRFRNATRNDAKNGGRAYFEAARAIEDELRQAVDALASAPLAGERADVDLSELAIKCGAVISTDDLSWTFSYSAMRNFCVRARAALASAPVAGEAVAYAIHNVDLKGDVRVYAVKPLEGPESMQDDAGWGDRWAGNRPLVYGDAAPQASKPAECAEECPPNQVCDHCQGTGGKDAAAPKKDIMRFNIHGTLINPHPNGMYVRYEDHHAALASVSVAKPKRAPLDDQDALGVAGHDRLLRAAATQEVKDGIGAMDALHDLAIKHGASRTAAAGFAHVANGAFASLEGQVHDEIRRRVAAEKAAQKPATSGDSHE